MRFTRQLLRGRKYASLHHPTRPAATRAPSSVLLTLQVRLSSCTTGERCRRPQPHQVPSPLGCGTNCEVSALWRHTGLGAMCRSSQTRDLRRHAAMQHSPCRSSGCRRHCLSAPWHAQRPRHRCSRQRLRKGVWSARASAHRPGPQCPSTSPCTMWAHCTLSRTLLVRRVHPRPLQ